MKIKTYGKMLQACVFVHVLRVQRTSQDAILSFSNILVWIVKNASKW